MSNFNNILSDDMGHVIPRKDDYNKKKLEQKFNQMRENQNKETVDLNFDLTSGWDKDIYDKKKAEYEKTGELILPDVINTDVYKNKMEFLEERKEYIISTLGLDIDPGKWNSDKIMEEERYFVIEQYLDDGYINLIAIPKYKAIEDCKVGLIATGASSSYPDDVHSFLKGSYFVKNVNGESIVISPYKSGMAYDDFKGYSAPTELVKNLTDEELQEMGYVRDSQYSPYYMPIGRDITNHGYNVMDKLRIPRDNVKSILGHSNGGLNAMKTAFELLKVNPTNQPLNLIMCDEWQCSKYKDYIEKNINLLVDNKSEVYLIEPFIQAITSKQKPNENHTNKDDLYALYYDYKIPVGKIPIADSHASKYRGGIDSGILDVVNNGLHLENAGATETSLKVDKLIYLQTGYHCDENGNNVVCDWIAVSQDMFNRFKNLKDLRDYYYNSDQKVSNMVNEYK